MCFYCVAYGQKSAAAKLMHEQAEALEYRAAKRLFQSRGWLPEKVEEALDWCEAISQKYDVNLFVAAMQVLRSNHGN